METLALLLLLCIVVVVFAQFSRPRPSRPAPAPSVHIEMDTAPSWSVPSTGPVTPLGQTGGWVLNPASDYPLTVFGLTQAQSEEFKALLDRGYTEPPYSHTKQVMAFLLRSNARWVELEDYINRFTPLYLKDIAAQQRSSAEWTTAGEKDREDLLAEFRERAIQKLDVRPYCDLQALFDFAPIDATMDDPLLERFGFDAMQLYLRHATWANTVRVVSVDHRERAGFEQLVTLGLARRGTDIPVAEILRQLKLKEMSQLAADLAPPPFRRKSEAIAFLLTVPDIETRVGKVIAFRELFQLLPLPVEFVHLNLADLATAWRYAHTVAELMQRTYVFGGRAAQSRKEILSMARNGPLYWTISTADNVTTCPCCLRAASVVYSKQAAPHLPLHPGCRCVVLVHYSEPLPQEKISNRAPVCEMPIVVPPAPSPRQASAIISPNGPDRSWSTVTIHAIKLSAKGKARFRTPDGFEGYVEQIVLHHFQCEGWQGVWGENYLWWMIMALLFWDVYFAPIEGAFEPLLLQAGIPQDMPKDLFQREFFPRRESLIRARADALSTMNLQEVLTQAHAQHYGKPCRPIERWDKFTLTELQQVMANIPLSTILPLMLRLLEDFNNNRRGLPDLVLWKEGNHVFVEVKGPGDTLSEPQKSWLSALQTWGAQTILANVASAEPS